MRTVDLPLVMLVWLLFSMAPVIGESKKDPLAPYRAALKGGDPARGKTIFFGREDIACQRCHKANNQNQGGDIGPELKGIGKSKTRLYLLESIVLPNKVIAKGFESVLVTLKDGATYAGQVTRESGKELEINSPEEGPVTVLKKDIKEREPGLSPMPAELARQLTLEELRDLIAYLSTL